VVSIETTTGDRNIISALEKLVEKRISASPIVDDNGKLQLDIYSKTADVINLAVNTIYINLDLTLKTANYHKNGWFKENVELASGSRDPDRKFVRCREGRPPA
ncbi:hypothetical protein PV325_009506, partial [Microctonus aethiopoides]